MMAYLFEERRVEFFALGVEVEEGPECVLPRQPVGVDVTSLYVELLQEEIVVTQTLVSEQVPQLISVYSPLTDLPSLSTENSRLLCELLSDSF
jgi:hypothetical protein